MKIKHKIKLKIKQLLNIRGLAKGTSYTSTERKNNSRVSRRSNYDQIDRNLSIIVETNLKNNTGVTVLMNLTTDIFGAVFLIQKTCKGIDLKTKHEK